MIQFGPTNSQCHVFTQKEGLLSAIAHDLELEVTDFTIEVDESSVQARCNAESLRVLHALKDGKPFEALSEKDKKEIQGNIVKDVLDASKYPNILFVSSSFTKDSNGGNVSGTLTLHGVSKSVEAKARLEADSYIVELPIHQPDFNIRPYSAMLGTLRVMADVLVRITVPRR